MQCRNFDIQLLHFRGEEREQGTHCQKIQLLNVTEESLFPDLDAAAQAVSDTNSNWSSVAVRPALGVLLSAGDGERRGV